MRNDNHVIWHKARVTRSDRERLNGHRSGVLWFTGLSGSGKSTIAHAVEEILHRKGVRTYVFDGDNVRHGLCRDLSFSPEGRAENLRRIGEMVKLFLDAGLLCFAAFISPMKGDRERVRKIIGPDDFFEVFVDCPLEVCESRDVKGLYKLAREGKIKDYTGISAPYERPEAPDLVIESHRHSLDECVDQVLRFIYSKGLVKE